jgi:uncharacterized protein YndB with AHSA1/START domain
VIDGDRVVYDVHYAQAPDRVWRAITDSAALARWLMPNDFVPKVGHRFTMDASPNFGVIDATVLVVDPPRLLECEWMINGEPTIVRIELRPDGDGTRLLLEHRGLASEHQAEFDGGWDSKLRDDLTLVLQGDTKP